MIAFVLTCAWNETPILVCGPFIARPLNENDPSAKGIGKWPDTTQAIVRLAGDNSTAQPTANGWFPVKESVQDIANLVDARAYMAR
jgi:hypothetical protein